MRWVIRTLCVALGAIVVAAVNAPLGLISSVVSERVPGVTWTQIQGTVWNGRISNLSYGPQALGDANLSLQPMALLRGRLQYRLELNGSAISGDGHLFVSTGQFGARDVNVTARIEQLVGLNDAVRAAGGTAQLRNGAMIIADNSCVSTDGALWTDALVNLGQQYNEPLPELSGDLGCEGGLVHSRMHGAVDDGIEVAVSAQLGTNAPSSLQARVDGAGGEIARALLALGFYTEQGTHVYTRTAGLTGGSP